MKQFKITLTEEEINYVINVIASRPFNECHEILDNIQSQANTQLQEKELKE